MAAATTLTSEVRRGGQCPMSSSITCLSRSSYSDASCRDSARFVSCRPCTCTLLISSGATPLVSTRCSPPPLSNGRPPQMRITSRTGSSSSPAPTCALSSSSMPVDTAHPCEKQITPSNAHRRSSTGVVGPAVLASESVPPQLGVRAGSAPVLAVSVNAGCIAKGSMIMSFSNAMAALSCCELSCCFV